MGGKVSQDGRKNRLQRVCSNVACRGATGDVIKSLSKLPSARNLAQSGCRSSSDIVRYDLKPISRTQSSDLENGNDEGKDQYRVFAGRRNEHTKESLARSILVPDSPYYSLKSAVMGKGNTHQ